jgi:hypothetical protein
MSGEEESLRTALFGDVTQPEVVSLCDSPEESSSRLLGV